MTSTTATSCPGASSALPSASDQDDVGEVAESTSHMSYVIDCGTSAVTAMSGRRLACSTSARPAATPHSATNERRPMTRDFRLFCTGQVTSAFGSVFTMIALPLIAVRELGATPAEVGLLVAAGSVPLMALGVFIAAWVDRLPRRRPYLIGCDLAAAAAIGCVMLAWATDRLTVWDLVGFAFVLGTLGVIVQTAYFAHLRSVVGDGDLVRARARLQGGEHAGGVVGRVLAGPALVIGALVPLLVDLVSYLVSALCLMRIGEPEPRRPPGHGGRVSRRELGVGFALLYRESFLRRVTPLLVGQQVVNGITLAVLAPFLLTVLDVPTSVYGLTFVLVGVAAVAGSIVSDRLAGRVDPRTFAVVGCLGMALSTLLLPFAGGPLAAAVAIAALGIGLPYCFGAIANIGLTAFVTARVPDEQLGRAGVSLQLVSAAALVAGSVAGGLLAQEVGIRPTLWIAAGISGVSLIALRPLVAARRAAGQPAVSPSGVRAAAVREPS